MATAIKQRFAFFIAIAIVALVFAIGICFPRGTAAQSAPGIPAASAAPIASAAPATQTSAEPWQTNTALHWTTYFKRDAAGFTIFPMGQDGRIILISSSEGSDFGDGSSKPVRTLKEAMSLVRDGFPDRVLFKRGDIFPRENLDDVIQTSGRSFAEPLVLGAYGDVNNPRPLLEAMLSIGGRKKPNFVVIQSLDFYADARDPNLAGYDPKKQKDRQDFGIYMNIGGHFLWVEDCRCRYFVTGMIFQSKESDLYQTLVVRRCVITDSYDPDGHSQGIYIDNVANVLIEENIFDHNGWNEKVPGAGKNIFNHNMYIQHGEVGEDRHFIVRDNISARASSHGCQLRPGGLMENNLFLKNPLAAFVSYTPSIVRNNVILGGDDISPDNPRGQGLQFLNCATVLAEGNIIAHMPNKPNGLSALGYDPAVKDLAPATSTGEFRHNIVYDWSGPAFDNHSPPAGLSIHDNIFDAGNQVLLNLRDWRNGYTFASNRYQSATNKPFIVNEKEMNFDEWSARTGDTSKMEAVRFVDPHRDITTYATTIGLLDNSLDGFMAACREQHHGHWDPRLTADAVNRYIREGFAMESGAGAQEQLSPAPTTNSAVPATSRAR